MNRVRRRLLSAALTGCGATLLLVVLTGALLSAALEAAALGEGAIDTIVALASSLALFAGGSTGASRMARTPRARTPEVFLAGLAGVLLAWLAASTVGMLGAVVTGDITGADVLERLAAVLLWVAIGGLGAGVAALIHTRRTVAEPAGGRVERGA
jgi:hypothetical protein